MINTLHPLLEELAAAPDDAGRAAWLLAVPLGMMMTYSATIANRLTLAGFADGAAYFDIEMTLMRARRECGFVVQDNPLRQRMLEIAGFVLAGD